MQEHEPVRVQVKSRLNIIVTAVIAVVLIAAAAVTYSVFDRSYNTNLDKLKQMIAAANADYTAGASQNGATTQDEYAFYKDLSGQVDNLSQLLQKLNAKYPLLLGKGSDKSLGIADLNEKMDAMAPKLDVLKTGLDEETAISAKLTEILSQGVAAGQSLEYANLIAMNDALASKLSGIVFEGPIEADRAAFASSVGSRSKALDYLMDDAAVSEELAVLSADMQTAPADLKTKYEALAAKNDALSAEAEGIDLKVYGSADVNISQMIADRKALIGAYAAYMGELAAVQGSVTAFCSDLDINTAKPGKLSEKMVSYAAWIKQLKDLRGQLEAIDAKEQYKGVSKRDIATLGMSPAGQTLLNYENALSALSAGIAASKEIEKQIDTLLAEKKMDLPDKTNALLDLDKMNDAIIASLAVEVPEDLKAGFTNFVAACNERGVFLEAFMSYVEDQQIAAGYASTSGAYSQMRKDDLSKAAYWATVPGGEASVQYYNDQAKLHAKLAGEQTTLKNEANKNATAHKKDYEASRAKYVPLLDT